MKTELQGMRRWLASAVIAMACALVTAGCSGDSLNENGARADINVGSNVSDGVMFGGTDGVTSGLSDAQAAGDVGGNVPGKCDFPANPAVGQPGAPCVENTDCDEGYCVEGADGRICTRTCVDCCPQGFACQESTAGDAKFICTPRLAALCRPCLADSECAAVNKGALCVTYGAGGGFCGGACAFAADCPVGYACEDTKGTQGAGKQCVRKVGQCGCSPKSITEGAATFCATTNAVGTCGGLRKCTQAGLGACDAPSATAEQCNGVDDDCDGETDEDAGGASCMVSNGFGSCPGAMVCEAGSAVCKGLEPAKEQCNGQDDDCDGATDEGFPDTDKDGKADCLDKDKDGDSYPDVNDCDPDDPKINPGAAEACNGKDDNCDGVTDEKGAKGCKTFYADVDGDQYGDPAKSACLCQPDAVYKVADNNDCNDLNKVIYPAASETCNGADDNCDGKTDEGYQLGGACEAGVGKCKAFGKMVCAVNGASTVCSAKAAVASQEVCDGLDNNCNGQTDEGFQLGGACTAGKGACAVSGKYTCSVTGAQAVCDAVVPQGKAEVCDGIDNDCDGQTDEGCDQDKDGYCNAMMTVLNNAACPKGKGDCDDTRKDVHPGHVELCDKRDNNCDGTVDTFKKDCSNGCGKGTQTCGFGTWSTCSAPKPKCTSGACCDGCNFRSTATKCGTKAYKTSYKCSGSCGGQVRKYESWQYCSGSSASCGTSNLKETYKGVTKTCSGNQLCTQSGSSATCSTCGNGCVSGKCSTQPKHVICIDPQFGGSVDGASFNGVTAKNLNLDIALKLKTLLEKDTNNAEGGGSWQVVMTRTTDTNPAISTRIATCDNAGTHRLVSVAVNAYNKSTANGIETWYAKSSSKTFCTLMQQEVQKQTGFFDRGIKIGSYKIVKSAATPYACMSAPGFISNTSDVNKLKSASFRTGIAKAMMYAIQKSFGYSAYSP